MNSNPEKATSKFKEIWSTVKTFLIALAATFLFVNFVAHPVTVVGSSMYPTLEDGEYGFTNIFSAKHGNIYRNDVVIVKMMENGQESLWVKRVIGLPGETIECIDDEIYINGVKIDESEYIDQKHKQEMIEDFGFFNQKSYTIMQEDGNVIQENRDWGPIHLAEDEYFVMGDNRPHSSDSRVDTVGPVKRSQIYGKSLLVLFPIDKMGWN